MFNSQSQFSTFGWWVGWVYLLSLAGLVVVPAIKPLPPLPAISFADRGITVTEQDGTVIEEVTATVRLSKPADARLPVSIDYIDNSAKLGRDFDVQGSGKSICFEPGEQEKVIRFGRPIASGAVRDVMIVGPTTKPAATEWVGDPEGVSFIVQLKGNAAIAPVGDDGRLAVTILRADRRSPTQPRVGFAQLAVEANERALPELPIALTFDRPLPEPAAVKLSLYRREGAERKLIERVEQTLKQGERGMSLKLSTLFSAQALAEHRVVDDPFPEADERYELELMSSDVYPGDPLALMALNDDGDELKVQTVSVDGGRSVKITDNGPDWIDAADRWWRLWATLPDGERIDLGPARTGSSVQLPDHVYGKCNGRRIAYEVAHTETPAGKGRCQKSDCKACPGGGCPKGQCGKGKCGAGKALCGPAVPGDYLLIVVNNERLHEPGDSIVDSVRQALKDESARPYDNGAIIVNPKGQDGMTATAGGPVKDRMFQPFERAGEDVAAQLERVEQVIAEKREAAERPDLRAVVVWPERDLASGAGLKEVDGADQQPVSFFFPAADPSFARNMRKLVPPKAESGGVTVRAPHERELFEHLRNALRQARSEGEDEPTNRDSRAPTSRHVPQSMAERTAG
jgi:hypothetical protein